MGRVSLEEIRRTRSKMQATREEEWNRYYESQNGTKQHRKKQLEKELSDMQKKNLLSAMLGEEKPFDAEQVEKTIKEIILCK